MSDWIKTSEKEPPDNQDVLGYFPQGDCHGSFQDIVMLEVYTHRKEDGERVIHTRWVWNSDHDQESTSIAPTYWQPLPRSPNSIF